jgi:large subunit ribosomal protein L18
MTTKLDKNKRFVRRKRKVRGKIFGTKETPRLTVFRSRKFIYAQVIDDENGKTIVSASDKEVSEKSDKGKTAVKKEEIKDNKNKREIKSPKMEKARMVGETLAKKALKKKVKMVKFDKSGYKYHGRVKALADGAREGGLQF